MDSIVKFYRTNLLSTHYLCFTISCIVTIISNSKHFRNRKFDNRTGNLSAIYIDNLKTNRQYPSHFQTIDHGVKKLKPAGMFHDPVVSNWPGPVVPLANRHGTIRDRNGNDRDRSRPPCPSERLSPDMAAFGPAERDPLGAAAGARKYLHWSAGKQ